MLIIHILKTTIQDFSVKSGPHICPKLQYPMQFTLFACIKHLQVRLCVFRAHMVHTKLMMWHRNRTGCFKRALLSNYLQDVTWAANIDIIYFNASSDFHPPIAGWVDDNMIVVWASGEKLLTKTDFLWNVSYSYKINVSFWQCQYM